MKHTFNFDVQATMRIQVKAENLEQATTAAQYLLTDPRNSQQMQENFDRLNDAAITRRNVRLKSFTVEWDSMTGYEVEA